MNEFRSESVFVRHLASIEDVISNYYYYYRYLLAENREMLSPQVSCLESKAMGSSVPLDYSVGGDWPMALQDPS